MRKFIVGAIGGVGAFLTLATAVYANGYSYDYTYDLPSTGAAAAALGTASITAFLVPCCCLLGVVILDVVLAILVYRDAEKNKVENGVLWAILTFFFNVIGLLVYFLAIKPEAVKKKNEAMGKPETVKPAPAKVAEEKTAEEKK